MVSSTAAGDLERRVENTAWLLLEYCKENEWAGYDPYDALNSRLFTGTPLSKSKWCRIAFTQLLKRLPLNLRPVLLITKEQNPKALALFLMTFVKKQRFLGPEPERLQKRMIGRLIALRAPNTSYFCWGYSFPWQGRAVYAPKWQPNLVCTVFVAMALLDAYESGGEKICLEMATSAARYILDILYWSEGERVAGLSYPNPGLKSRVHNANLLGAALFSRIYNLVGDERFRDAALILARYSTGRQHADGSWWYGEHPKQHWVDNFHTGYNLCALHTIGLYSGTAEFESHIRSGLTFYLNTFFRDDGAPKYFHDRTYPIDIHAVAQSIITLLELKDLDNRNVKLAHSVFNWAREHMWDENRYFYFQAHPMYTNKTSYMRWSQAWMLLALATLLEDSRSLDLPSL